MPARAIVQTAHAVAGGRMAAARSDWPAAITIQDALPYTERPYWYYPVRPSLGASLLRAGRLNEAEDALRASLARTPSNGWAISGLMEVYRERGDHAAFAAARKRFETTWLGTPRGPALSAL